MLRFLKPFADCLRTALLPRRHQVGRPRCSVRWERSLELFRSANPDVRGKTLLDVMDETLTPMGGRLLRRWLQNPLLSLPHITARHEEVEELTATASLLDALRSALAPLRDLERLAARFSAQVATPKDAAALRDSLAQIPALTQALHGDLLCLPNNTRNLPSICQNPSYLQRALVDLPPLRGMAA